MKQKYTKPVLETTFDTLGNLETEKILPSVWNVLQTLFHKINTESHKPYFKCLIMITALLGISFHFILDSTIFKKNQSIILLQEVYTHCK